jgi:hypothetical protein
MTRGEERGNARFLPTKSSPDVFDSLGRGMDLVTRLHAIVAMCYILLPRIVEVVWYGGLTVTLFGELHMLDVQARGSAALRLLWRPMGTTR